MSPPRLRGRRAAGAEGGAHQMSLPRGREGRRGGQPNHPSPNPEARHQGGPQRVCGSSDQAAGVIATPKGGYSSVRPRNQDITRVYHCMAPATKSWMPLGRAPVKKAMR